LCPDLPDTLRPAREVVIKFATGDTEEARLPSGHFLAYSPDSTLAELFTAWGSRGTGRPDTLSVRIDAIRTKTRSTDDLSAAFEHRLSISVRIDPIHGTPYYIGRKATIYAENDKDFERKLSTVFLDITTQLDTWYREARP
jgi:hypothetical protein